MKKSGRMASAASHTGWGSFWSAQLVTPTRSRPGRVGGETPDTDGAGATGAQADINPAAEPPSAAAAMTRRVPAVSKRRREHIVFMDRRGRFIEDKEGLRMLS
jgi:hypothetical protein